MKKFLSILILCLTFLVVCQTFLKAQSVLRSIYVVQPGIPEIPIGDVTIMVKGTTVGTITDMQGCAYLYCLPNATLALSRLECIAKEVNVDNRTYIKVFMYWLEALNTSNTNIIYPVQLADNKSTFNSNSILDYLNNIMSCKSSYIMFT